jgi:PAS domain S-box-containing protein
MADHEFKPPPGWSMATSGMSELFERTDWSATALGAASGWSPGLKLAVGMILASAFPMALRWGPEFILLYNDAYRPILGDKHPWALGRPAREAWAEVWQEIEPAHLAILNAKAPAIFADDIVLRIQRHGSTWEDAHFTLGYSAIEDATAPSGIGGILVTAVEITNRVAAQEAQRLSEEALRENRSFLDAILRSSGEAFYAVDRQGRTTLCNHAFLKMLGFAEEGHVIGRKLHDLIHHSHPNGAPYDQGDCPIYVCAKTAKPAHVKDEVFFRSSGEAFPVEYWVRPIFRAATHQGAICTLIDITERKAAEAELARSEAEFRTFAQAMPNHVWASAADGQLNWFNERVYEYSGRAHRSLDGVGWVDIVHPDDRAMAAERWSAALASGETYQTEFRLRRFDGAYRWHLARALPIRSPSGDIERWIGTNTDIEDERRVARALAALNSTLEQRVTEQAAERDRLWQTSRDLLGVIDRRGIFRAANPAWTEILGWQPYEIVGRNHWLLVHPEDQQASRDAFQHARDAPLPVFECRYMHKDGGFRWISWIASIENELLYATGRHVTAEKQAAAELSAAQEALRQSQKMEAVGQLTGGIAHDFNNMLAVVIGSLELLGRRLAGGDARAQRYLAAAADGARRASLLTQRLLAFSRQQPLRPEAVDVNKVVAGMSDLLRHSIGADIRLETVLAGGLWPSFADPNQLENIVLNLALNSRDAMPDGGRLTIETQNAHLDDRYVSVNPGMAAGQYVLIAVTDTGSGMAPEVIEKAFDPFFTTKPVGKGTGLGLSQVYGFVKQSGGHVKIYSEIGHGTTIKIYLPRLIGTSVGSADAGDFGRPLPLGELREVVLVVEDEPAVRRFSVEAICELGYRVLEADGAAAALRLLDSHPEIVLLFTDVVMPDINGAKLADEARRRRPGLKVLFTTGYTRNAIVHNGVLDPGVEMIGKPFTLDALAAKIRSVLEAPMT